MHSCRDRVPLARMIAMILPGVVVFKQARRVQVRDNRRVELLWQKGGRKGKNGDREKCCDDGRLSGFAV